MMKPITVALFAAISSLLLSCGGLIAEGGTGGTGVTTGTVQGYGSIFVNDVEFDVNNAVFLRNGQPATNGERDYAVGEVVTVKGAVSADGKTGTADEVVYESLLTGTVSDATPEFIRVLGQDVLIDGKTVLVGFNNPESLNDKFVEVSGLPTADGAIRATIIKLISAQATGGEIRGIITAVGSGDTFSIGDLVVEYTDFPAGSPEVGLAVEVEIEQVIDPDRVLAGQIELIDMEDYQEGTNLEFEGIISVFNSVSDFEIAGYRVITDGFTEFEDGTAADLGVDVRVEVKGRVDATGAIQASKIEIVRYTARNAEVEIIATVDAVFPGSSSFEILGLTAVTDQDTVFKDRSSAEIEPFEFDDLQVGDWVEIDAELTGGNSMRVDKVSRRNTRQEVYVEGALNQYTASSGELVVSGVTINTDSSTIFRGPNGNQITTEKFFDSLVGGVTDLEVSGTPAGSQVQASTVEIDD